MGYLCKHVNKAEKISEKLEVNRNDTLLQRYEERMFCLKWLLAGVLRGVSMCLGLI